MLEKLLQNRKRTIFLLLLVFGFFMLLLLISSYSLLTISSSDTDEKTIYIKSSRGLKEIALGDESKTLLLRRDDYTIEVSGKDNLSLYNIELGMLRKTQVDIELLDQKNSEFLGVSELPCSRNTPNSVTYFYSCQPSKLNIIKAASAQSNALSLNDYSNSASENISLAPYKDGWLESKLEDSNLSIRLRDINGAYSSKQPLKITGFNGSMGDEVFSVSESNGMFAAYDDDKKIITKFSNTNDLNPTKIQVPKDLISGHPDYITTLKLAREYAYLFEYADTHDIDDEAPTNPSKIIAVFNDQGELVKKHKFPDEWKVSSITSSSVNSLVVIVSTPKGIKAYLVHELAKPEEIKIPSESVEEVCWKDADSFYYLSGGGTNIFLYSLSEQAAYLVYAGLFGETTVSDLNCVDGSLGFNLNSPIDGESTNFVHYQLGKKSHSGNRLESVLPIYFDLNNDTFKMVNDRSGLKIDLVLDDKSAQNPTKNQVRDLSATNLSKKGINTESLNFVFDY